MTWTFLSNHAHVFFLLSKNGDTTIRDLSIQVGITERCVQSIINDLEKDAYIKKEKNGRLNHYTILKDKFLRHPIEKNVRLDDLINIINHSNGNS